MTTVEIITQLACNVKEIATILQSNGVNKPCLTGSGAVLFNLLHRFGIEAVERYINDIGLPNDLDFLSGTDTMDVNVGFERVTASSMEGDIVDASIDLTTTSTSTPQKKRKVVVPQVRSGTYIHHTSDGRTIRFDLTLESSVPKIEVEVFGIVIAIQGCASLLGEYNDNIGAYDDDNKNALNLKKISVLEGLISGSVAHPISVQMDEHVVRRAGLFGCDEEEDDGDNEFVVRSNMFGYDEKSDEEARA